MRATYYIGIDPDVTASGVCVWNAETREIERLQCQPFYKLCQILDFYSSGKHRGTAHVIIDAGWLNRSNFHARVAENHRINAQIGERTGANHQVGKLLAEICEGLSLSHDLHRPTHSKVNADYFAHLTGWKGRTNQEMRDAAMLVFGV